MELKAGLYIVSTPIGNLEDITLRALFALRNCDLIYCEDTRNTHKLLQKHGILEKKLAIYNDHSDELVRTKIAENIANGMRVALVSDAGTPLISDPGYKLVRYLQDKNMLVDIIPGACAAIAALVISGVATDKFYFAGFMPRTEFAKKALLTNLQNCEASLIFYESAGRVFDSLAAIYATLGNREVALVRELTKIYQQNIRKPVAEIITNFQEVKTKGEFVIIISAEKASAEISDEEIAKFIELRLGENKTRKDIAEELIRKYPGKFTKNYIYKLISSS